MTPKQEILLRRLIAHPETRPDMRVARGLMERRYWSPEAGVTASGYHALGRLKHFQEIRAVPERVRDQFAGTYVSVSENSVLMVDEEVLDEEVTEYDLSASAIFDFYDKIAEQANAKLASSFPREWDHFLEMGGDTAAHTLSKLDMWRRRVWREAEEAEDEARYVSGIILQIAQSLINGRPSCLVETSQKYSLGDTPDEVASFEKRVGESRAAYLQVNITAYR